MTTRVEDVARRSVYAVLAASAGLAVLGYRDVVPLWVAAVAYWAGTAAVVGTIRVVEARTHPEQRGWWTWLLLLLGGAGLLAWLRHLDREH